MNTNTTQTINFREAEVLALRDEVALLRAELVAVLDERDTLRAEIAALRGVSGDTNNA